MQNWKEIVRDNTAVDKIFCVANSYYKTACTRQQDILHFKQFLVEATRKPLFKIGCQQKSRVLFFYGIHHYRLDHMSAFEKVTSLVKPHDNIYPEKERQHWNLKYVAGSLYAFFLSIPYALQHSWSLKKWMYFLSYWIQGYQTTVLLKSIDLTKYRLVVVFCDTDTASNIIVQQAQKVGCLTATVQHGMFMAPREHPTIMDETGAELLGFVSDYFLMWSEYAKEQAIKAGIPDEKIKVVGLPKFIGVISEPPIEKNNCFGVILGWAENDEENRRLINMANVIAQRTGARYYLKYHPSYREYVYDRLTNSTFCAGKVEKDIPLSEYVKMTDFSIVGNSSMFVELSFLGQPVYHLHCDDLPDKYEDIKSISFSTPDELSTLISESDAVNSVNNRNYLCGPLDPMTHYQNFFREILL